MPLIYKIVPADLWAKAEAHGRFVGASVDLADGFIHFSTADQVRETARRHFSGQRDLVVVAIEADVLGADLRWEASRGGNLFPHLYAPLDLGAVRGTWPLPLDDRGTHSFPSGI